MTKPNFYVSLVKSENIQSDLIEYLARNIDTMQFASTCDNLVKSNPELKHDLDAAAFFLFVYLADFVRQIQDEKSFEAALERYIDVGHTKIWDFVRGELVEEYAVNVYDTGTAPVGYKAMLLHYVTLILANIVTNTFEEAVKEISKDVTIH